MPTILSPTPANPRHRCESVVPQPATATTLSPALPNATETRPLSSRRLQVPAASKIFLAWLCALPLFLLACGNGSTSSVWPTANPNNHYGNNNPNNHYGNNNPNNHNGQENPNDHYADPNNPVSYGTYGNNDATTSTGPLRWHLCNCLVSPSSGLIIPRRTYNVCATNPINAETYSNAKCRPFLASGQRCTSCVCTPLFACSTPGASL